MTDSEIIPQSPETDSDHESRQAEYEALATELVEKELELATLETELAVFEGRYARTIGILFAELDALEQGIARELWRLHPEEKYKREFQDAERKARASNDTIRDKLGQAGKKEFRPSDELKGLYRRVAKTIHPDLAINQDDRAFRTTLMARANAAYRNGDLEALRQILAEWESGDPHSARHQVRRDEPDSLERKIQRVRARLKETEARITTLKESELYKLMQKVEQAERQGRDLLAEMAGNLLQQIQQAQERLDSLKRQRR